MSKIITVVGARPQFIKAAAVSRQLSKYGIDELIVHTGQHFDENMSDVFFREMEIPLPAYNLEVNSLGHGAMTGRMMESLEKIMIEEKPSAVLVYGDTNSTLAGALVAKKLHIRVVHVEAGLRSFNMDMPEEINRILTDRISDLLFCPTDAAIKNLKSEGFDGFQAKIIKNGDVMQDAAYFYIEKARNSSTIRRDLLLPEKFVLATIHRQENTDNVENLKGIIEGLNRINSEMEVVVPLHPRTRKILSNHNITPEFRIIDPVGYFDMISLLDTCSLVITDSGGVQKEAFFFKKHCVTMREQTEWVELVENGFNMLCGSSSGKLYDSYKTIISKKSDFTKNLYGDGKASEVIAKELQSWL
ncbi:MAG: non-hydrolyzing UDP-N-acetylglucosamine 2-epimerase [Bacteroidales bacterium]